MRKIIGIGETILDIIFRNNQPVRAVAGGSTFNSTITLGRLGLTTSLITELGCDQVGNSIIEFMKENHVGTELIDRFGSDEGKTPVSLAFLDEENNAHYTFYHQYPAERLDVVWPRIDNNDIVIFGSYFSVNPVLRSRITELIEYAKVRKAIIYYDPNFRAAHGHEAMKLMPSVLENLEYADIVRGSSEDFEVLFRQTAAEKTYRDKIKFYCPSFIYTNGSRGVELFVGDEHRHFDATPIEPVSTIGAGDTFNAGVVYGLIKHNVTLDRLASMTTDDWAPIIETAQLFASEVCMSEENYLSRSTAEKYRL